MPLTSMRRRTVPPGTFSFATAKSSASKTGDRAASRQPCASYVASPPTSITTSAPCFFHSRLLRSLCRSDGSKTTRAAARAALLAPSAAFSVQFLMTVMSHLTVKLLSSRQPDFSRSLQ